ncbi:MAG: acyl-CoA dehydratase activase-related protein [bacterium]
MFLSPYLPFWHTFWTKLGHKVIVSSLLRNKGILDHGVKEASTDLCVSSKGAARAHCLFG